MVLMGKNSNNEYFIVPEQAIWYLEYFKIISCCTYAFNDPRYGESGMVKFEYDKDKKSGLDYEVANGKWKLYDRDTRAVVATFEKDMIKIGDYCISQIKKSDSFSVRVHSEHSGISSEVSLDILNDKKIDISLNCAGDWEYNKSTAISRDAQLFNPVEYFDRMSEGLESKKYLRCSSEKLEEENSKTVEELGLLDRLIHDPALTETLREYMKSMIRWEYKNTMRRIRQGKSDKSPMDPDSFEEERMTFIPSEAKDIRYTTHR